MDTNLRALIVEDSEDDALLLVRELKKQGYNVEWERVETGDAMSAALEKPWDLILSDFSMPKFDAPAALRLLQESGIDIPFIVISGTIGEEVAVETLKAGAHDYLMKGRLIRLGEAIRREIEAAEIRIEHKRTDAKLEHLNRVLHAIRNVNQLIVREKDPRRLIEHACRDLVETRGYRTAWIAVFDDKRNSVMTAEEGCGAGFAEMTRNLEAGRLSGCCDTALAKPDVVIVTDPRSTCSCCPLRHGISDHGSLTVRLENQGEVYGLMSVNFSTEFLGDEEEISLLSEIAGDIAFALHGIEQEQERVRAQEELKRARVRTDSIVDSMMDILLVLSKEGIIERANPAALAMLGYRAEELTKRLFSTILEEEEEEEKKEKREEALIARLAEEGFVGRSEKTFVAKDGETIPVLLSGAVMRDAIGGVEALVCVARDIRDRKRAERLQRLGSDILVRLNKPGRSREVIGENMDLVKGALGFEAVGVRLRDGEDFPYFETSGFPSTFVELERSLCARSPAGETVRDSEGNVVLECMCGNVICGRTDASLPFFTSGGSFWTNESTELLASTTDEDRLTYTRNRCNEEGYESIGLIPLRTGDETLGLLQLSDRRRGMFTLDMIEFLEGIGESVGIALSRKKAEDAVKASEENFRTVFHESTDGILLADMETRRFHLANETMLRMMGYTLKEVQELGVMDIHPAKDLQRVMEDFERQARREIKLAVDIPVMRKDGSVFHSDISSTPVVLEGKTYLMGSFRDNTERRQMQASLAQSDRLASMGMLAAGVAHEINNPLAYILYNLESLTDDLPRMSSALRKCLDIGVQSHGNDQWEQMMGPDLELLNPSMLDDIRARFKDALEGSHRIRDVARGLRVFSRVERDQLVPVNLMHVIEVAINMVFNEIKYRSRLVKEYGKISPIMANDGRLSQVFLNLLVNAAHAIDEGNVEDNEIRVKTWQEGDGVFAEVSDTGKGIAKDHLPKLFEPFFTTKELGLGTGLGLSISKNIIEGYGGCIKVASEVGKGTRFVIRLPVKRAEEQDEAAQAARVLAQPAASGRILVIDDEAGIRAAMVRMLRHHEVVDARSGSDAQKILEADQAFDLILCDMMMPAMSGVELHEWLLATYPELADQVVFITGGAFTPKAREYLNKISNLQMEKPFDVTNFKKTVSELIVAYRARGS